MFFADASMKTCAAVLYLTTCEFTFQSSCYERTSAYVFKLDFLDIEIDNDSSTFRVYDHSFDCSTSSIREAFVNSDLDPDGYFRVLH